MIEKLKQENCCTPLGQIKRYEDCYGCDRKPKQETHICKYCNAETTQSDDECYAKPKTLEEVAERLYPTIHEQYQYDAFIQGAKWMKERMYSEEEVINAFNEGQALNVRGKLIQGKEWFEQFKKK